jgi:hypothetical protein
VFASRDSLPIGCRKRFASRKTGLHPRRKAFHSRVKSFHSRVKSFLSRWKSFHSRWKSFHSRWKSFLSRWKGFLSRWKGFLSRWKVFPTQNKDGSARPTKLIPSSKTSFESQSRHGFFMRCHEISLTLRLIHSFGLATLVRRPICLFKGGLEMRKINDSTCFG